MALYTVTLFQYPASRYFSLTWFSAFTKSFASLVSRELRRLTSDASDFLNAESHVREISARTVLFQSLSCYSNTA